tara:strand:+ start:1159 stop:1461 length:303 start_codon:yes stop_codon:yes gene_type:complete
VDELNLEQLAPVAEKLGAWGTGVVVALILTFRLLKQWIEYRRARNEASGESTASEVDALLEMVVEDEQEDAELIGRVDSITVEIAEIRAEIDALKHSLGE